jgi:Cu2+-exporting ATPase
VNWIGAPDIAAVVAAAERESNHPIARGLAEHADGGAVQVLDRSERFDGGVVASFRRRSADGVAAGTIAIGSPAFASKLGVEVEGAVRNAIDDAVDQRATAVVVGVSPELGAIDGFRAVAVAWLRDEPLDHAPSAIRQLERLGWRAEILSGDQQGPVEDVAARVGVPVTNARHGVTPEGKLERVRALGGTTVVMVGDGVNDAAALAAADVGIAVHGGAEASLAAADLYVARPGVEAVVDLVRLARRTLGVARGNLVVSLCYNALAIGLAAAGTITPLVAAVLMPISSASVLAAAIGGFSLVRRGESAQGARG